MTDRRVLVVGSHIPGLLIRVATHPRAGETVHGWGYDEPMDGGKGSNQAIAAARLGARVSFVGTVGDDPRGEQGERWLREAGVDVTFLKRDASRRTGVGFVVLDALGVPTIVVSEGAAAAVTEHQVESAIEGTPDAAVLLTQFEIPSSIARFAARAARSRNMISIVNPAPYASDDGYEFPEADVLCPNETEANAILASVPGAHDDSDEALALRLRELTRSRSVIITLGERGIAGSDALGTWSVRPPQVTAVDTTGAGDAFCGALATAVARGDELRAASAWACACAALSVRNPGTIPDYPREQDVGDFLRREAL